MLPVVWLGDMTRLATELGRWTAKLSLARLQQDAELPERAMERERETTKVAKYTTFTGPASNLTNVRKIEAW